MHRGQVRIINGSVCLEPIAAVKCMNVKCEYAAGVVYSICFVVGRVRLFCAGGSSDGLSISRHIINVSCYCSALVIASI